MQTPQYQLDVEKLKSNYKTMSEQLKNCNIHYVLKTNAEKAIISVLKEIGSSFECASINEYELLLQLGVTNEKIICGAVIKPVSIIKKMYASGCRYFVFDDLTELKNLIEYAPLAKKILRLYISDICPDTIEFGMRYEEIKSENFVLYLHHIDGISFHLSNNDDYQKLDVVFDRVENILLDWKLSYKEAFILNIGGSYSLKVNDNFYELLQERIKSLKELYHLNLYAEPGLSIVNTAIRYYTKVVRVRKTRALCYDIYIEGGYPHGLIRPPRQVNIVNGDSTHRKTVNRFYDLTCIHNALFSAKVVGEIKEGDILELMDYGAYTVVYQNKFHMFCPPNILIKEE